MEADRSVAGAETRERKVRATQSTALLNWKMAARLW